MTRRLVRASWVPGWLALGAIVLFGVSLGARDLWNPNEPLYGRAVVEMAERGDWLLPTVNGVVFDEKPILYFWLARLAGVAGGGVNEWTLRLPSFVAGLVLIGALYFLVSSWVGTRRAAVAAVVAGTLVTVFLSVRSVQMDILLAAAVTGAIAAAVRGSPLVAGLALGLGLLAKGPVILPLVALPLLALCWAEGRHREVFDRRWLLAAAVAGVVSAPWFVWLALSGHEASLVELIWRQNMTRAHAAWDHESPWWYFLVYFWIDFAPWSFFVPLAAGVAWRTASERRIERLAWLWIAAVIGLFSLSQSKRSAYLLPAAAPVAILVSGLFDRWWEGGLSRRRAAAARTIAALIGAFMLAAGVGIAVAVLPRYPVGRLAGIAAVAVPTLCGIGVLAAWGFSRAGHPQPVVAVAIATVAIYLTAAVVLLPEADRFKSARTFGEAVRTHCGDSTPIVALFGWRWRAGYSYYARRSMRPLPDTAALRREWDRTQPLCVVVERSRLEEAREVIGDSPPIVAADIGSNSAYLFTRDLADRERSSATYQSATPGE